jgi:hypothetical protein
MLVAVYLSADAVSALLPSNVSGTARCVILSVSL